jgi:hypothetical protein
METMSLIQLKIGDWVQRVRPLDGSALQGQPDGPMLRVQRILPRDPVAWCELSDGRIEPETAIARYDVELNCA